LEDVEKAKLKMTLRRLNSANNKTY